MLRYERKYSEECEPMRSEGADILVFFGGGLTRATFGRRDNVMVGGYPTSLQHGVQ